MKKPNTYDEAAALRVLDTPMLENDAEAKTIREYLVALATGVFREGEGFSGKRPFGNSGWVRELDWSLAAAGLVKAERFEDDGYVEFELTEMAQRKATRLICCALYALASAPLSAP